MEAHSSGLRRETLTGRQAGAVHTGFALAVFDPGAHVDTHLHSTEQSFYVLSGHPSLTIDGRSYRLSADDCGLLPVGVPHSWHNAGPEPAWLL
jgi:mannose-6-phosphate isomerase-like protein (cupin superfamily)